MTDDLARALTLLADAPIFDGHNDLPWVIRVDPQARGDVRVCDLAKVHERGDTDIPRLRDGRVGAQFWAAFQPTNAPHPARTTLEQIDVIHRIEDAHPETFHKARSSRDVARAKAAGKIASFVAVEGGVGIENALAPLRVFHAAGMRLMTLCHNESLDWIDSATDAPRNGGLNAFGRAVVGELNRLGVVIDGSHVSHEGIRRVLDASEAPIALTHSNSFSLCDHPRNAPDDIVRRIGEAGGIVMATFVPGFTSQRLRDWLKRSRDGHGKAPLGPDPKAQFAALESEHGAAPRADVAQVAEHVEKLLDLAGAAHVGIGSDFFGGPQPDGLEHVGCFPNLIAELLRRRVPRKTIEGIAGGNMLRTLRAVERVGKRLRKSRGPALGRIGDYPGA